MRVLPTWTSEKSPLSDFMMAEQRVLRSFVLSLAMALFKIAYLPCRAVSAMSERMSARGVGVRRARAAEGHQLKTVQRTSAGTRGAGSGRGSPSGGS